MGMPLRSRRSEPPRQKQHVHAVGAIHIAGHSPLGRPSRVGGPTGVHAASRPVTKLHHPVELWVSLRLAGQPFQNGKRSAQSCPKAGTNSRTAASLAGRSEVARGMIIDGSTP